MPDFDVTVWGNAIFAPTGGGGAGGGAGFGSGLGFQSSSFGKWFSDQVSSTGTSGFVNAVKSAWSDFWDGVSSVVQWIKDNIHIKVGAGGFELAMFGSSVYFAFKKGKGGPRITIGNTGISDAELIGAAAIVVFALVVLS